MHLWEKQGLGVEAYMPARLPQAFKWLVPTLSALYAPRDAAGKIGEPPLRRQPTPARSPPSCAAVQHAVIGLRETLRSIAGFRGDSTVVGRWRPSIATKCSSRFISSSNTILCLDWSLFGNVLVVSFGCMGGMVTGPVYNP